MLRFLLFLQVILLTGLLPGNVSGQINSQTSFGKNRVQYHRHFEDWMHYETEHFDTYWYGDARNVAQAALQTAEYDFQNIQQLLEHQMMEKIEMLVFIDVTDLKQSNIGEDEVFKLKTGETKVIGNKVFVYFDGNHLHLQQQIREGIAGVLLNSMLFGANLQEIVQNAVLLDLPGWFTSGLLAYCGEEWNADLDNQFRDVMLAGRYKNFDKLAREHPRLAGHAFWYYIGLHYGKSTISNLLYLTRINRSLDAGFLYVLGTGYRRSTDALMEYFSQRYADEALYTEALAPESIIKIRNKRRLPLYSLRLSPDGRQIAWASNDIGKWKVWVMDLETRKKKRVLKGGIRNALQATDLGYPILAWNPDNERLGVLAEKRDVPQLYLINTRKKEKVKSILAPDYQRVFSMDFLNPSDLVLSAAMKGYADLFIYRTESRQTERLTQDFWDDLDASVVTLDGQRGILFSSNRISDTLAPARLDSLLPLSRFDVFFLNLEKRSEVLQRITNTVLFDERQAVMTDSAHFAFLSDESGVVNRQEGYLEDYIAYYKTVFYLKNGAEASALNTRMFGDWPLDKALRYLAPEDTVRANLDSLQIDSIRVFPVVQKKAVVHNQTNYQRNLDEWHTAVRAGKQIVSVFQDGRRHFYLLPIAPGIRKPARITRFRELYYKGVGLNPPEQQVTDPVERSGLPEGTQIQFDTVGSVSFRDTSTAIESGWFFQVPDYLEVEPPVLTRAAEEAAVPNLEPAPKPKPKPKQEQIAPLKLTRKKFVFGAPGSIVRFYPYKIVPYRLKFRTDYVSTNMDNNLLFEGLDSYAGSPDGFRTPPPGILMRANFKDLLEDYVLEAGFRLPTTFNGAEYYLWFDNKKRRLDRRVALYRKTIVNTVDGNALGGFNEPVQVRTNTLLGQYEVRYPIDPFLSLRGTATLRQDKTLTLSTSRPTLEEPDYAEQRAALRLSVVYDNTVDIDINLRTGSRARLFVEAVKRFEFNTQPEWSLRLNSGFMTVVGLDARHYQRLDRRSVLALRFAGATTFGSERILYFLGGVDNWIFPQFNNNIPVPQDENFAYQTLAAHLRGFRQNIRNGSSYALLNTELRVPIFKYFSNKPVLGNFWRNFQVVGFFDTGTAWVGRTPYGGDNPLNTVFVNNPPTVFVRVNYFRDPLVAGYGFGLRALLFGIYLRADYAWGIETRVVQKPMLHLALGADF